MESLTYGLTAALAWGVHDVCVRYVSQKIDIVMALSVVLAVGLIPMFPFALHEFADVSSRAALISGAAGFAYAVAGYGLYRAFSIGPLRLVAPIIGAYPILSLLWAAAAGTPPTPLQWLAVLAIVGGVSLIAILSDDEGEAEGSHRAAIFWAVLGGSGFALTFALGQAASREGAELPTIFITRAVALIVVLAALMARRRPARYANAPWMLLCTMGILDALALGLVLAAGPLPRPEFAAVSSSVFGIVTILLAWAFLKERMTLAQWCGVLIVFGGIGYLGL